MRTLTTLFCIAAITAWCPAAGADTGGPDQGGYQWADIGEEGVTYDWIDVSADGAGITLGDDQQSAAVDIGFPFIFYGESYEKVRIGSNGFLSFQSNDLSAGFAGQCPLPMPGQPDLAVYGFYQDLDPSEGTSGPIYIATTGEAPDRVFVAVWDGVEIFQNEGFESDPITTQILLYEGSNEIQVNLMDPGALGGMPVWTDNTTLGIEGPEGTAGLGLCPGLLPSDYAMRFSASDGWNLFPDATEAVAPAGGAAVFTLEMKNFGAVPLDAVVEVVSDAGWDVDAAPAAVTLPAGGGPVTTQVTVSPDAGAAMGATDAVTVTVTAGGETRTATLAVVAAYPTDAWQDLPPLPEALRYVELVSDGDALYAIGGMSLDADLEQWVPVATVLRWDPDHNAWDDGAAADLPVVAADGRACFMDGRIYYAGGYDGPAEDDVHWSYQPDLLVYDISADSWTNAGPLPMKTARAAVVCHGAKVYVVNGIQDLDDNGAVVTGAEDGADGTPPRLQIYDAAGGTWSEGAPPPTGASAAAAMVLDGTLLLAGGTFDNPDDPAQSLVTRGTALYDITGDAWDADGPLLSAFRSDMGAARFRDTLCVVGGRGTEATFDTWECYTGAAWIVQADPLSGPRFGNGVAGMGDFLYTAGGADDDALIDLAARWPTGDLGEPIQPEPAPDTGGDPDVVAQPDTFEPGADTPAPGDDTAVIPGDDTAATTDTGGGGGSSGGGGGGGCAASGGAAAGPLSLLLALGLALRFRRRRV